ncbi:uncharacterized protein LOC127717538 [Mytilus californianus]|uniref:uncharacterized protein LOC127717538 n=1 Tax=Mytilus californianus TaxID=6549 RepID=UPI00224717D5|nr:uncharacterized protein LOC127717538 [Mytilus californianus]
MSSTKAMFLSNTGTVDTSVGDCILNILPPEFWDYFMNNMPGGCDTGLKIYTMLTNKGEILKMLGEPTQKYAYDYVKRLHFLLSNLNDISIEETPGIWNCYADRLKKKLRNYCSVTQLYHMFCCWIYDKTKFQRFLRWACDAEISNAGFSHIRRAVTAFRQKYCLLNKLPYVPELDDLE